MNLIAYVEHNIKNILVLSDTLDHISEEEFNQAFTTEYFAINLLFIEINTVPVYVIITLNELLKSQKLKLMIGTTSRYLSLYFSDLGITHTNLNATNDNYFMTDISYSELNITNDNISQLLLKLYQINGYDFRQYSILTLQRSIFNAMKKYKITSFQVFETLLFEESSILKEFVNEISINVSSFFRDVDFFKTLKDDILLKISDYPHFKIWSAGCANGMEAYSLAIILKELGLLHRCIIYGTDFNNDILDIAKNGIYNKKLLPSIKESYTRAGGNNQIEDYLIIHDNFIEVIPEIKEKVYFFNHNLTHDSAFNQFELILCRNVMIYFEDDLKLKVLNLFNESMIKRGFLALGTTEKIHFYNQFKYFNTYNSNYNIYQKYLT